MQANHCGLMQVQTKLRSALDSPISINILPLRQDSQPKKRIEQLCCTKATLCLYCILFTFNRLLSFRFCLGWRLLGGVLDEDRAMPLLVTEYLSETDHPEECQAIRQDREKVRALLVDYDAEDSFEISRLLTRSRHIDFSVSLCGSADAAKCLLKSIAFDVVYVDYWLGFETCIPFIAEVARLNLAPVVTLTGVDSPDVRRCAYRAGSAGFLAKENLSIQTVESVTLAILRHKHSNFDAFPQNLAKSLTRPADSPML
jgi:ActR/RegA family two-component response regulator